MHIGIMDVQTILIEKSDVEEKGSMGSTHGR